MKKLWLIAVIVILCAVIYVWRFSGFRQIMFFKNFGKWEIINNRVDSLPWIDFYWSGDSIGGKWVQEAAIFISLQVEGMHQSFNCQFDIGCNLTLLYGNPLKPYIQRYLPLKERYGEKIFRKDTVCYLSDLHLQAGSTLFSSPYVLLLPDYGEQVPDDSMLSGVSRHIGTIGVDVCRDRVLIIDYPHHRLCLLDSVPATYNTRMEDITLDDWGRPILKMAYHGRNYKISFDCGSSTFPLLMRQEKINELSTAPGTDTISISSWGHMVNMVGRPMKDSFTLAGHTYGNVEIYTSEQPHEENVGTGCDGLTGNILFLDKVLVLDFRHHRLGLL